MGKKNCSWVTREDPSVRAQIDANKEEIGKYSELKSAISNVTNSMSDCLTGLNCCYDNITKAVSGTDFSGIFDSNILSYKNSYTDELADLETMITNIETKMSSLEAENAKLNKKLMVTVWECS